MTEIVFRVETAPDGGLTATAIGNDIFTEADDIQMLRLRVDDAVECHFEQGDAPLRSCLSFFQQSAENRRSFNKESDYGMERTYHQ
jgi:hypothetical protein